MSFGVNAVVLNAKGEILLARRNQPDIWNLPGGSWEPGEAPWDTAVREVREEVGLEVKVERLTGFYDRHPDGEPVLVYLCSHVAGTATTSPEAVEVGWFSVDSLPHPIHPYQPDRIRDALRGDPQPTYRRQDGPSVRVKYPDR